jgi:hypothetical protein
VHCTFVGLSDTQPFPPCLPPPLTVLRPLKNNFLMEGDSRSIGRGPPHPYQPPPLLSDRFQFPQNTQTPSNALSPPLFHGQGSHSANPSPVLPPISSSIFSHVSPRELNEHGQTKSLSPSYFDHRRFPTSQPSMIAPRSDPTSTVISPGGPILPSLPSILVSPSRSLTSPARSGHSFPAITSPMSPQEDPSVSLNSLIRRNTPTPTMGNMLEPLSTGQRSHVLSPPQFPQTRLPPLRSVVGDYLPSSSPSSTSASFRPFNAPPPIRSSTQEDTLMQDAQMLSMLHFHNSQLRSPDLPRRTKLSDSSNFVSFSDPGFSQPASLSQQPSFGRPPVFGGSGGGFMNPQSGYHKPSFPLAPGQQHHRMDALPYSQGYNPTDSLIVPKTQSVAPSAPRCCSVCGVTSTPRWRKGPKGRQSLCNSCGLKFIRKKKKEIKMAEFEPAAPSNEPSSGDTQMTDV